MFQNLLMSCNEEERQLFEQLYKGHRDEMYYTAYVILENVHDAEDVVQESFIAVLANLDKVKGNTPERSWNYIVTIVKNKAYNLYKKKKRRMEEELIEWGTEELLDMDLETRVLERRLKEILAKLVKQLPDTYRDVMVLQYYYGLEYGEIARTMDTTPDNVRHISMRAKRKLKSMMIEHGYFGGDRYVP